MWTIRGRELGTSGLVSAPVSDAALSPHPARAPKTEAAPDHPSARLALRSPSAGSPATATDRAESAPGKRDRARYGTAGMDPADTPRRPSPARWTTRSIGGPPARCGPADACPAPTAPSHAPASPPSPLTAHTADTGTAHHPTAAVPRASAPYREGGQPGTPGVERQPDESLEAAGHQRGGTGRGRCREQPTAKGTRPRDSESPPARASWRAFGLLVCDHSYSRNNSSILRLASSYRPTMHSPYRPTDHDGRKHE
ncbi:hypothetical protein SUDANB23_01826 [Streptomyces sp. enrichment culture]